MRNEYSTPSLFPFESEEKGATIPRRQLMRKIQEEVRRKKVRI
jgi:hypothetical protein